MLLLRSPFLVARLCSVSRVFKFLPVSPTDLCYVPVDDRAHDLLTITSVTQVPSDEYDNNSGSTTAAKISVSFRPDLN